MAIYVSSVRVVKYHSVKVTIRINDWRITRKYYLSIGSQWTDIKCYNDILPARYRKDLDSFLQGRRYQSRVRKAIRNAHAGLGFPCRIAI